MKIAHIITRLILGGAQENTLITCKGLADKGYEVILITGPAIGPEGGLFAQTNNANFKTIVVNSLRREINPLFDVPAYFAIKKILKNFQPDIVHTHSAKAGILGRFAAVYLKNKPKVIHSVHGLSFHKYQNSIINKFYIFAEQLAAKKTDAFICVADAMREKSLAAGIGHRQQYSTAYSAIDVNSFTKPLSTEQKTAFRQKYNIAQDAIVLVCIARLFHLKGHKYIIESAKMLSRKYPQCVWLFVGNGILRDRLKNQIADCGLENKFRFTGLLDTSQMPLVLQSSDILVHCSLREGLARVLPQALASGIPAVSFDIDGAREVINSHTGRLVEAENITQLTTACDELIADGKLRDKLGTNGQNLVSNLFRPQQMTDAIEKVYKSCTHHS